MDLHPVLREWLEAGPPPAPVGGITPREARLPAIANKVHAAMDICRAGKTTLLRQLQHGRQRAFAPERAVYLSFDDDRLPELPLAQLDSLLEEY